MKVFFANFFESKYKLYLFLVIVPLLLFKRSLSFGFSPMDEQWMIENNTLFLSEWSNLKSAFLGPTSLVIYYRPLFVVTTIVDYHIGKLDPAIYHFTNILWHLGCVVLLFKFLLQCKVVVARAFFLSIIFAVHPLTLHAVAWIPGRNDTMLCLFMLASFVCLNNYTSTQKSIAFVWHIFFFICALFAKENAIVLPIIFAFIIYTSQKFNKKTLLLMISFWLSITLCWFVLRKSIVPLEPEIGFAFLPGVKNIATAFLLYIGKVIFPIQQSVFPVLRHSSVIPGVLTTFLFIFLWWRFKPTNQKMAALGILIFFILLVIPIAFSALKNPGEQYEHRVYASLIGIFLFFSQLRFNVNSPKIKIVFVCLAACLAFTTYFRMAVYKDQLSFLENSIQSFPEHYYFYLQKGEIFDKRGDYNGAVKCFNLAIEKNPRSGQAYLERGNAYMALGKKKQSLSDYTTALNKAQSKSKPSILMQRCFAYDAFGETDLAIRDLRAIKKCCQQLIEPGFEKNLLKKMEIEKWQKKIDAKPSAATLYLDRALFFIENLMVREAVKDIQKACDLEPQNKGYRDFLERVKSDFATVLENNN